jgi:hypothetical protein
LPEERALVKNASDREQIRDAKRDVRTREQRERADVADLLKTPAGRRWFWRMLKHCKVFETVFESSARIYYNAGIQDVGHFVLDQITDASPEAFLEMIRENREEKT